MPNTLTEGASDVEFVGEPRTKSVNSDLYIETHQIELLVPFSDVVWRDIYIYIYMGCRMRPRNQRLDVTMRHPMRKNATCLK